LNFISPEKNNYSYILEGYESRWNDAGNSRIANYTKLDPGEYTFKVKVSNNDNLWDSDVRTVDLVIVPPFYKTILFRILAVVFFLVIAILLHYLRIRSIASRKRYLEKQVKYRTKEVEEQKSELERKNLVLAGQAEELRKMNIQLDSKSEEIRAQAQQIRAMNTFLEQKNIKLTHDIQDISEARILQKQVSFSEFKEIYPDDDSCLKFLDELKWTQGYKCRKCNHTDFRYTRLKERNIQYSRRCKKCKNIESPTVGTIYYHIKFPLVKAFYITFLVMSGKNYTIDELSEKVELRRQTCWSFKKKVQEFIRSNGDIKRSKDGWSHIILEKQRMMD
jgi:hypothetical protein